MPCEACNQINRKLSGVQPHAALKLVEKKKWDLAGAAVGTIEYYECGTCGAKLIRDLDKKDAHANWEISAQ